MISPVSNDVSSTSVNSYAVASPQTVKSEPKVAAVKKVVDSTAKTDSAILSEEAKFLKDNNINPLNSNIKEADKEVQFSLDFNSSLFTSATANGVYNKEDKSLAMKFSFKFSKEVTENGVKQNKLYEASIDFNSTMNSESSSTKTTKKEDVLSFISRIFNQLADISSSKDEYLGNIIFSEQDLTDILGITKDDLGNKFFQVLKLVDHLSKMQHFGKKSPDAKKVDLVAERKSDTFTEEKKSLSLNNDLNIKIQEVDKKEE